MKKMRRIIGVFLVSLMLFCASLTAFAAKSLEDYGLTEETALEAAQQYYSQIADMSDEELEMAMEQYAADEVLMKFFESWSDIKDDLGAFVQTVDSEFKVTLEDGFSLELPIEYENETIYFTIVCNEEGGIESMYFGAESEEMTLGTIFKKAGLNTILGMGTVFAVLILISFLIYLLGVLCGGVQKKEKSEPKTAVTGRPASVSNKEEELVAAMAASVAAQEDDTELVAVISAAIAASTGMSTDDFVVRSIRKVKRNR